MAKYKGKHKQIFQSVLCYYPKKDDPYFYTDKLMVPLDKLCEFVGNHETSSSNGYRRTDIYHLDGCTVVLSDGVSREDHSEKCFPYIQLHLVSNTNPKDITKKLFKHVPSLKKFKKEDSPF